MSNIPCIPTHKACLVVCFKLRQSCYSDTWLQCPSAFSRIVTVSSQGHMLVCLILHVWLWTLRRREHRRGSWQFIASLHDCKMLFAHCTPELQTAFVTCCVYGIGAGSHAAACRAKNCWGRSQGRTSRQASKGWQCKGRCNTCYYISSQSVLLSGYALLDR